MTQMGLHGNHALPPSPVWVMQLLLAYSPVVALFVYHITCLERVLCM